MDKHVTRDLFFTLPPAFFFLVLYFTLGTPWNYIFLGLSVVFFILAINVLRAARYN